MQEWKKSKLLFWTVWLLAAALLIQTLMRIDFILNPVIGILTALSTPLLIAGFLYYLLNPIIEVLQKARLKRIYGIILVMLLLVSLVVFSFLWGIPLLIEQTGLLISGIPGFIDRLNSFAQRLAEEPWMQNVDYEAILLEVEAWLSRVGTTVLNRLATGVGQMISRITNIAFLAITVPVILFYMFKDGHRFPTNASRIFPEKYRNDVKNLLIKVNETISSYISGKGMASLIVGVSLFVGYVLFSFPASLLLAFFGGITNFIPYVGPFIGAAPAVLIGLSESFGKGLTAALLVLVVQQVDGNFLTPMFVGKSLDIHPLTVILILLAAANIGGLVGMLIGVPVYAIVKTIVLHIVQMRQKWTSKKV